VLGLLQLLLQGPTHLLARVQDVAHAAPGMQGLATLWLRLLVTRSWEQGTQFTAVIDAQQLQRKAEFKHLASLMLASFLRPSQCWHNFAN